jgi:hypothetical protein
LFSEYSITVLHVDKLHIGLKALIGKQIVAAATAAAAVELSFDDENDDVQAEYDDTS